MRINTNIASMTTRNALYTVNRGMNNSIEKLSTGLRINSASDDAAGLGVSENLRTQIRGMNQALKNTQDAIALLNIADGALNEQTAIMQRMRELVVQAKNDTYTQTERDYMGQEFGQLMDELDRIAATTKYNGMQLFATPVISGNFSSNAVYTNTSASGDPLTANKTRFSTSLGNGGALNDVTDDGSGHHFNMLIGQNFSSVDSSAHNSTYNSYQSTAEDMLTIALGQMDTNTLFHTRPSRAGVNTANELEDLSGVGIFGDFSWDPINDWGDGLIDWAVGGGMVAGTGTVADKLDLMLRVIDGKGNFSVDEENNVFNNPGNSSPTGMNRINKMRANIGAMINRLEHTVNNLMNQETNSQAAESLIRDTDFASETAEYTRNQILSQSSTAMLAQANTLPSIVTRLLQ